MKSTNYKNILALALTSLLTTSISAQDLSSYFAGVTPTKGYKSQSNHNPLFTQRFGADPCAMVYDDEVYIYMTNDVLEYNGNSLIENTYSKINTINCVSSKDMVNWTDHGTMKVAGKGNPAQWASCSWAPTACHAKIDGQEKFFLYFANNGSGIGVVTSNCPWGPWTDPVGRELVSRNTPTCNTVTWLFDPAVFVDDDGTGYLYFGGGVPNGKNADPGTARVAKLGKNFTSIDGTPAQINPPYLFEDAGINKIGGKYIYSYCSNWNCPGNPMSNAEICYMTSDKPMGTFKYTGVAYANQGSFLSGQNGGNNHHSMFKFKGRWYMTYHARLLQNAMNICPGKNLNYRSTHVDYVNVNEQNTTISKSKGSEKGVEQVGSLNPYEQTEAETMAWMGGIDTKYGGSNMLVTSIDKGDWIGLAGVDFAEGASVFSARVSAKGKQAIKICIDKVDGQCIGYLEVPNTGGKLQDVTAKLNTSVVGKHDLFFVFSGDFEFDHWQFKTADITLKASDTEIEDHSTLVLTAETKENGMQKADFYLDDRLIGSTTDEPYEMEVNDLEPGDYTFKAVMTNSKGEKFETNGVSVHVRIAQGPFEGIVQKLPGTIEVERFDVGGDGFAFYDSDNANNGGEMRDEQVDIKAFNGGYKLGWTVKGEWLEYTIDIEKAGIYEWSALVSTDNDNASFHLELDDEPITDVTKATNTGDWDDMKEVSGLTTELKSGKHILKLVVDESYFDIDWIKFEPKDATNTMSIVSEKIKVVPNPASDYLKVTGIDNVIKLELTNSEGRAILTSNDKEIRLNSVTPGLYILKIKTENGVYAEKVIIK